MVHRTKMQTINIDDAPAEGDRRGAEEPVHPRADVEGRARRTSSASLHTKDLLAALCARRLGRGEARRAGLAAPPWFVPDTTSVTDQLNEFLKRKAQLALVVDEYGEVQGLITLEDILEEIVGQITDEHDTQDAADARAGGRLGQRRRHGGGARPQPADGLGSLPDEEATTIAGLVIHEAQTIPEPGQAFTFYGYRFEILRKSRNKITAIRIRPIGPADKPTRQTLESDAMEAG